MGVSICSVVYQAAEPFLQSFLAGIITSAEKYQLQNNVSAIIVVDGLDDAESRLKPLSDVMPVKLIYSSQDMTQPQTRSLLLQGAQEFGHSRLVFTDCDDILEENALIYHEKVLKAFDFSYSDQILMDVDGRKQNNTLYSDWLVPNTLSSIKDLLDGNCVGFSGLAINRSVLLNADINEIPGNIIAIDWWLASQMLLKNYRAGKTEKPVVNYRQHTENYHGANPKVEQKSLLERCNIVSNHFSNFVPDETILLRLKGVEAFRNLLMNHPEEAIECISSKKNKMSGYFYTDVINAGLELVSSFKINWLER